MDSLHLSYDEVVYKIPYRNLIIMQKDKLHAVYDGEVLTEVSEEDFFKGKVKFDE
ncbi:MULTISPECIES: hypothetical protein [Bacteroides]|nr:hypothetical protein [Bacteroides faecis]